MPKARKYILSLDGGGFRGLSCLIILSHIMRELVDDPDEEPIPAPCQVFDLICGTSTGGLIAILLGRLGLSCSTAISVYKELGPKVFGNLKDEGKIWGNIFAGERISSAGFESTLSEIVNKYTGSENTTMKIQKSNPDSIQHPTTDTFVTTVSAGAGSAGTEAYRLRSYATPRGGTDSASPDHIWTICQAARATSAAPLYFAPLQLEAQAFQDAGASGFNNPTMEALQEAGLRWSVRDHDFVVVSLGTGLASLLPDHPDEEPTSVLEKVVGMLRKKWKNIATASDRLEQVSMQLVSVATETELTHSNVAKRFKGKQRDNYFRFNPPQGLGDLALQLTDHINEGLIVELTNVWLRSVEGKESTAAVYEKLSPAYEARRN